jgi:hypothetical protein
VRVDHALSKNAMNNPAPPTEVGTTHATAPEARARVDNAGRRFLVSTAVVLLLLVLATGFLAFVFEVSVPGLTATPEPQLKLAVERALEVLGEDDAERRARAKDAPKQAKAP